MTGQKIYGIDFTSRPKRTKPITCAACSLEGTRLVVDRLHHWVDFTEFEAFLGSPGPWTAGIDFPFGQSRKLIENLNWPPEWAGYVSLLPELGREGFRAVLNDYKAERPYGDKEHRRATDVAARSISPQKLHGVPVALMFYEGAPRLLEAGVTIPGLLRGDPSRTVVEAYPGVFVRNLIGNQSYKHDDRRKQTEDQSAARESLLRQITGEALVSTHGVKVEVDSSIVEDPAADDLDAVICAIQAAWARTHFSSGHSIPNDLDPLEGWISDPSLLDHSV